MLEHGMPEFKKLTVVRVRWPAPRPSPP